MLYKKYKKSFVVFLKIKLGLRCPMLYPMLYYYYLRFEYAPHYAWRVFCYPIQSDPHTLRLTITILFLYYLY